MYGLFDIGGTNIRMAVSKDGETFGEPVSFRTPTSIEEAVEKMLATALTLGADSLLVLAGGIPGVFNQKTGELERSPNLQSWIGKPLRKMLEDKFSCKVLIENDAAIVGLGEAVAGAGRGHLIVEYLTVSTGVGGAKIVDEKIDEKSVGFEPGQIYLEIGDGNKVTLEETISGRAIEKRFGVPPKEVKDEALWEELAEKLAYGLYDTIVLWSPDVVVLGGSMIVGDPAISVERVDYYLKKIMKIFPKTPVLKKAELGNFGGLYGALHYIKQNNVN